MPYHTTYAGLEKWFVHCFEKLGWILLAVEYKRIHAVEAYLECVENLVQEIQEKHASTVDIDRKADLENLLFNAKILHKYVKKHIKTPIKKIIQQQVLLPEQQLLANQNTEQKLQQATETIEKLNQQQQKRQQQSKVPQQQQQSLALFNQ